MILIIVNRIHRLIFILQIFLGKPLHHIESNFLRSFSRHKRNNDMIPLSFIHFSKSFFCIQHLLKGRFRQAVQTAHQNIAIGLFRILNIIKSLLQMPCRITGIHLVYMQYLSDCHVTSTSCISLLISSRFHLIPLISLEYAKPWVFTTFAI